MHDAREERGIGKMKKRASFRGRGNYNPKNPLVQEENQPPRS
jgi:hypothetical protein